MNGELAQVICLSGYGSSCGSCEIVASFAREAGMALEAVQAGPGLGMPRSREAADSQLSAAH